MSGQENSNIEIKSAKARKIVEQVPSFIIRTGIISLVLMVLMIVTVLSLIDIEPQIKVNAILIGHNDGQITGYLLLPYKETLPTPDENQCIVKTNQGNVSFQCRADMMNKKKYVDNTNTYWQIPLVIEKNLENSDCIIAGQVVAYAQFKSTKISMLKWLFLVF